MHAKDADGNFLYGKQLQDARANQDEVFLVVSNLDSRTSTDGLIQLLWSYHKRFENRALACIQNILNLVVADESIADFMSKLPSYDYNMARFTDFIRPYLIERMTENEKYQAATGYKEKQEQLTKITSALD